MNGEQYCMPGLFLELPGFMIGDYGTDAKA